MRTGIHGLLAAALLAAAPMAQAGQLAEAIFRPGAFAETREVTRYRHDREGPEVPGLRRIAGGELQVAPEAGPEGARLTLSERVEGKDMPIGAFPAAGGDPVLLWFLESTVRSMATLTEGSPFYIRNRLREALGRAELDEGTGPVTVELRPFEADPNRARMGAFSGLVLTLTVDPGAPVPLRAASADTTAAGGSYRETLRLEAP